MGGAQDPDGRGPEQGHEKEEIAAPAARSLPRIPVKNASDGSTCVESCGPPRVRM
jgi:hypothetical protein